MKCNVNVNSGYGQFHSVEFHSGLAADKQRIPVNTVISQLVL